MGYDISIVDPVTKEMLELEAPHILRGGTYVQGGTTEAWLSETFNYSVPFQKALGKNGIWGLNGKSAAQAIHRLERGVKKLRDDVTMNYWDGTEGNAKQALYRLLALCRLRPDGIIRIN